MMDQRCPTSEDARVKWSNCVTTVGAWLAIFACLSALYRLSGLHAQFLRAELGYFIEIAWQYWTRLAGFYATYVTHASNGHFTPLAFLSELYQARLARTSEQFWFYRQVALIATLAVAFWIAARTAIQDRVESGGWLAAGLATLVIMQPAIDYMVTWPFMALQFLCAILGLLGVASVYRFAATGSLLRLCLGLGLSYASMHAFGVGLAFSTAALVTSAMVMLQAGIVRSQALVWTFALVMTLAHAAVMAADQATTSVDAMVGWYAPVFAAVTVSSFQVLLASPSYPLSAQGAEFLLPGAGLLVVCVAVILVHFARGFASHSKRFRADTAVIVFPIVFMAIHVALISLRVAREPLAFANYVNGPRYQFFSAVVAALAMCGFARIIPFPARATRYAACALIGWGVVLNGVFLVRNAPVVWPDTFVSHAAIWKEVLKETQSSIHEGRPTLQHLSSEARRVRVRGEAL